MREERLANHILFLQKIEKSVISEKANDPTKIRVEYGQPQPDEHNQMINEGINSQGKDDLNVKSSGSMAKILSMWNEVIKSSIDGFGDQLVKKKEEKVNEINKIKFDNVHQTNYTKRQPSPRHQEIQDRRTNEEFKKEMHEILDINNQIDTFPDFMPTQTKNRMIEMAGGSDNNAVKLPMIEPEKTKYQFNNQKQSIIIKHPNKRSHFAYIMAEIERGLKSSPSKVNSNHTCKKHEISKDFNADEHLKFKALEIPNYKVRDNHDIEQLIQQSKVDLKLNNPLMIIGGASEKEMKKTAKAEKKSSTGPNNSFVQQEETKNESPTSEEKPKMNESVRAGSPPMQNLQVTRYNYDKVIRQENSKTIHFKEPPILEKHSKKIKNYFNSTKYKQHLYEKKLIENMVKKEADIAEGHATHRKSLISDQNVIQNDSSMENISKITMINPNMNKTIRINNETFYDNIGLLKKSMII